MYPDQNDQVNGHHKPIATRYGQTKNTSRYISYEYFHKRNARMNTCPCVKKILKLLISCLAEFTG
jgi:hypothetical protein